MKERFNFAISKAKSHISIIFFIGGFLFDVLTLNRIDQSSVLIQQAVFLVAILLLLHLEIREKLGTVYPVYISKYKTYVMHFLFGALLSAFLIFYFLSSSGLNSILFLLVIIALMIANELPIFQKLNIPFKTSLFSICLISYLSYVIPTLLGFMGSVPVLVSAFFYFIVLVMNCMLLGRKTNDDKLIGRYITIPSLITLCVFLGLYFLKVIPPVPISIKKMGIYRSVEKEDGKYQLTYARHAFKFWQKSEVDYYFQPGDKVYSFASIFSPTKFNDKVLFQWSTIINDKWVESDQVPIRITGGRDGGFRAFTFKSNVTPGKWRIKVLTQDQREIGRFNFNIINEPNPYELRTDKY